MISVVISTVAEIIILALFIRAILSWFASSAAVQPVARFFDRITDPLIAPVRRVLPPVGGFDFSPLATVLLVWVVENVLLMLLAGH